MGLFDPGNFAAAPPTLSLTELAAEHEATLRTENAEIRGEAQPPLLVRRREPHALAIKSSAGQPDPMPGEDARLGAHSVIVTGIGTADAAESGKRDDWERTPRTPRVASSHDGGGLFFGGILALLSLYTVEAKLMGKGLGECQVYSARSKKRAQYKTKYLLI